MNYRRVFYGIEDRKVVDVMKSIPRELFVSDDLKDYAHMDRALPIDVIRLSPSRP